MTKKKKKLSIFKSYLSGSTPYKGGKSLTEVRTKKRKIYKLSSNENPIGSSPKAIEAIKKNTKNLHLYPERTDEKLRKSLSKFYNNQLNDTQFIGASSGSEVLDMIIRAFLGEGTECIICNPAFVVYKMFSTWNGTKVIDVPLTKKNYNLDIKGILKAINKKTRMIFLTSPNNPTGSYISKKELDLLFEKIPDHVVIVLDEVYFQFAEAEDYTTAMPYVLQGKNIIAVNSFSKAYGLAGMRIGYCYTTPEIANYVRQLAKPFLIDTLSLEAGIAALKDREFLEKTVQIIRKEKIYLYKHLDELKVKYWKSAANFILIKPKISPAKFEQLMLEEGVMVRPVANFGAPGRVRVTIGNRTANKAYVSALKKIYEK